MTVDRYDNWIGGAWQAGGGETPNLNPSDLSDCIGRYAQGDAETARHDPALIEAYLGAKSRGNSQG